MGGKEREEGRRVHQVDSYELIHTHMYTSYPIAMVSCTITTLSCTITDKHLRHFAAQ